MVSADRFARVAGWAVLALACLTFFGNSAEQCDTIGDESCGARLQWLVACGIIAGVLGMVMFGITLTLDRMTSLPLIEVVMSFFLLLWLAAGAGVAASTKTPSTEVTKGLSFVALFTALLLFVGTFLRYREPSGKADLAKEDLGEAQVYEGSGVPVNHTP